MLEMVYLGENMGCIEMKVTNRDFKKIEGLNKNGL
jgi:hypothetical protein